MAASPADGDTPAPPRKQRGSSAAKRKAAEEELTPAEKQRVVSLELRQVVRATQEDISRSGPGYPEETDPADKGPPSLRALAAAIRAGFKPSITLTMPPPPPPLVNDSVLPVYKKTFSLDAFSNDDEVAFMHSFLSGVQVRCPELEGLV